MFESQYPVWEAGSFVTSGDISAVPFAILNLLPGRLRLGLGWPLPVMMACGDYLQSDVDES